MRTLFDEFIAITRALNVAEIEYAVCGGWAMAVHGLPRTTQDIDLLILTKDLDKILDLLEKFGFDIKGLPLHIDVEIRRVSKISEENQLITVDLLLVNDSIEDVWRNRQNLPWDEGTTWVVSRDGLIKMKLIAGRKQDILDIEKLREVEDEG